MKLSLCITTFNRSTMVIEVFEKVYGHPLIDEIVIVDDASEPTIQAELLNQIADYEQKEGGGKIRLFRNDKNLGMSRNKAKAISHAKNEWAIIFDSDNILYPEYLEYFKNNILVDRCIYSPEIAEPEHDYREFSGRIIDKDNAKDFLYLKEFRCFLNTCNYVVNKNHYLSVYRYDETIKESDTIYFNSLWLEADKWFYIVPGMKYHHRKHSGSGWLNGDHKYNMNKAAELQEKIKNL